MVQTNTSTPNNPEKSTPGYQRSTLESRNKQRKKSPSGEVRGKPPVRKSPRLCEDDFTLRRPSKVESDRNSVYTPRDYEDTPANIVHRAQDTHAYFEPTPPASDRTVHKVRKQRHVQPTTPAEFEKNWEKAKRNISPRKKCFEKDEQEYVEQIKRLTVENYDLKKLKGEHETLKANYLALEEDSQKLTKRLENEKKNNNNSKVNHERDIKILKNKHEIELKSFLSERIKHEERSKRNFDRLEGDLQKHIGSKLNYEKEIEMHKKMEEERRIQIQNLTIAVQDKESELTKLSLENKRILKVLYKYKESMERSAEMENQIREHTTKYEKMVMIIEKYKELYAESLETNVKREDQLCELQRRVDNLATVEESHRTCLEMQEKQNRVIKKLSHELSASENNYNMLHNEYDEVNVRLEEEKRRKQNEETSIFQNMEKEVNHLQKEKENAVDDLHNLSRVLEEKENRIHSLSEQLLRSEEKVSVLSNKLKNSRDAKKLQTEESLQQLQIMNENQKLDLVQATKRNDVLFEQFSTLQKENANILKVKENAEIRFHELTRTSQAMERKVESLTKELTRLQDMEKEVNHLQKEKENAITERQKAEDKLQHLSIVLEEKEIRLCSLTEQLLTSEEKVSMLSDKFKDSRDAKKTLNEESLQRLQIENENKKIALMQATKRNDDLFEQYSTLQKENANLLKVKENAEIRFHELTRTSQVMERKVESLTKELTRSRETFNTLERDLRNEILSHRSAYDKLARENGDLTEQHLTLKKEKSTLMKDKEIAEITINDLTRNSRAMEEKIEFLSNELTSYSNKNEDLLSNHGKEIGILEKDKKNADIELSKLANALHEKEKKIEFLSEELSKSKDYVAMLSSEVKHMQNSKERTVSENRQDKKNADIEISKLETALLEKKKKIESLTEELAKSKDYVAMLSSEVKHMQESTERRVSEKEKRFQKENASLQSAYNKAVTNIEDLSKECDDMRVNNKKLEHNISELTRALRDKDQEITSLRAQLTRFEGIVLELKDQKRDGQNTEQKINKLSKAVRDKEDEIESLIDQLSKSEDKIAALLEKNKNVQQTSGGSIQQLQEENASLRSALVEKTTEADARISDLSKEIMKLQRPAKYHSGEHHTQKPHDDSALLEAKLADVTRRFEQLKRDYDVVKREKDHALNRLSAVAGEKLRDNNPGIADLSDENRPINLGEKFSQLYDDQWTDAIENLEEMKYTETDGIRYLIDILKRVFDECVRISEDYFRQLQELTGTTNLPSDQLKKLKDLRKASAIYSVNSVKPIVNTVMSNVFKNEKAACQTYIDRSIELCWLMCVQDPPVVIDFSAVRGTDIDDQKFRKFTKTGSKIDFLVWPVIRLHRNGPPLQKGVVQPL